MKQRQSLSKWPSRTHEAEFKSLHVLIKLKSHRVGVEQKHHHHHHHCQAFLLHCLSLHYSSLSLCLMSVCSSFSNRYSYFISQSSSLSTLTSTIPVLSPCVSSFLCYFSSIISIFFLSLFWLFFFFLHYIIMSSLCFLLPLLFLFFSCNFSSWFYCISPWIVSSSYAILTSYPFSFLFLLLLILLFCCYFSCSCSCFLPEFCLFPMLSSLFSFLLSLLISVPPPPPPVLQ